MQNFLEITQLSNDQLHHLLARANDFKHGELGNYHHITAVNMFFENSTRTHHSFEMAQYKLGMNIINFDAAGSSISKGESLYDTVLTMQAIGANIAVIRHPDDCFYQQLETLDIAIVNAGSGAGEHPSQSLLDIMTIQQKFNTLSGLTVAIIGDLSHSRVASSNMKLLNRLNATVLFSGPPEYYDVKFDQYGRYVTIDEALQQADVVMMLRIQLERHQQVMALSPATYLQQYGLTKARYDALKPHAIIMHPAPVNRDVEIASELIESPKSRIVQQMQNGVYARMAILEWIMKGN